MTKRKRNEQIRPAYSAAPLDENTGQQPAFPELVVPSKRDTEWSYDMEEAEIEEEEEGRETPLVERRRFVVRMDYYFWQLYAVI